MNYSNELRITIMNGEITLKTNRLYIFIFLAIFIIIGHARPCNSAEGNHHRMSKHASGHFHTQIYKSSKSFKSASAMCGNAHTAPAIRHFQQRRHRRAIHDDQNTPPPALYFDGTSKGLILDGAVVLPRQAFTIELWLWPEGGQYATVPLIAVRDQCDQTAGTATWQFSISSKDRHYEKHAQYEFLLRTEMAAEASRFSAQSTFTPLTLTRLVATFDGHTTMFYVNNARLQKSSEQAGALYSAIRSDCKRLVMAGVDSMSKDAMGFRGYINQINIWNRSISHQELIDNRQINQSESHLVFSSKFEHMKLWKPIGRSSLESSVLVSRAPPPLQPEFPLRIPSCGQSLCDNADIVLSYAQQDTLRLEKTLRYQVINIFESDGTNPSVTEQQIRAQHLALLNAFEPYNISWTLQVVPIRSSALRYKTIVFGCDPNKVGDGECDRECRYKITADDGGDCIEKTTLTEEQLADKETEHDECLLTEIGNNNCETECNLARYNWDGGDCCNASRPDVHLTCVDPRSSHRGYIGVDEYKSAVNISSDTALTVTFADWSNEELIGLSVFPWEKESKTTHGGIILQASRFGMTGHLKSLVHEIGHVLGLWHVHHGVSEVPCSHHCFEHEASLTTGDLVGDTQPTPKNMQCRDPNRDESTVCDKVRLFRDTPFTNYMSYSPEACTTVFSPQQTAKMHCYIDLVYRDWLDTSQETSESPIIVPLAPKIIGLVNTSAVQQDLLLSWVPPIGVAAGCRPANTSTSGHAQCSSSGSLTQFAYKVWTGSLTNGAIGTTHTGYWSPQQAIGECYCARLPALKRHPYKLSAHII